MDSKKLQAASDLLEAMIKKLDTEAGIPNEDVELYIREVLARMETKGKLMAAKTILDSLRGRTVR